MSAAEEKELADKVLALTAHHENIRIAWKQRNIDQLDELLKTPAVEVIEKSQD